MGTQNFPLKKHHNNQKTPNNPPPPKKNNKPKKHVFLPPGPSDPSTPSSARGGGLGARGAGRPEDVGGSTGAAEKHLCQGFETLSGEGRFWFWEVFLRAKKKKVLESILNYSQKFLSRYVFCIFQGFFKKSLIYLASFSRLTLANLNGGRISKTSPWPKPCMPARRWRRRRFFFE